MPSVRSIRKRTRKKKASLRPFGPVAVVLIIVCVGCAYAFHDVLWNRCANFLIAPDSPEKSDLIFILGGDYLLRAPYAARLYQQGYAPKILVAHEPVNLTEGRRVDFTDDTIQTLEGAGVPKNAIVDFSPGTGVRSTADEARALRIYAEVYPVKSVLVVTTMMHSRRARMAIRRALLGKEIRVLVACVGPAAYRPDQWPQAKQEMIKLIYYFFTFWG
jgi:uncharacterized SAM-binding protein YcdF (DUF218 family)